MNYFASSWKFLFNQFISMICNHEPPCNIGNGGRMQTTDPQENGKNVGLLDGAKGGKFLCMKGMVFWQLRACGSEAIPCDPL